MSLQDHGERAPIVSYFGLRKQKVITGYVTPGSTPQVIDILSYFVKDAVDPTNPATDSFVITAISIKAVCRVDATTLTSAQLSPVWPDPIRRGLSTPAIRVLAGTVEGLPEEQQPLFLTPFFYVNSPLIEKPMPSAGIVGPTVYPRNFNKEEFTIWHDEVTEFPLVYVPDINGVDTSRTILPQSKRQTVAHTMLQLNVNFRFESIPMPPFGSVIVVHRDAVHRPFLMFVTDQIAGAPLLIHFNYQINIVFHDIE